MEPENDGIQNESPFPGFASFKSNFRGAHLRLYFQRSIFTPKIWGSDEAKFDYHRSGIFASADAEKLSQLTLRSQKSLKRVTKRVISLKLTAKART